ncbi:MAG: rod shape-determining protein MreD [Bacteroidales bacterium]|nr:rod shape-determining protein MreD [Bacteroidales bacterium]
MNKLIRYLIVFVLLCFIQVFLLNSIQINGYINPFLYVMFILVLPFEISRLWLLIVGFLLGFTIDMFCGTPGMHTSATVFIAFLRPYILRYFSPRDGYTTNTLPTISYYGFKWFFYYSLILVSAHHMFLFIVEAFRLSDILAVLARASMSISFTMLLIVLSQYLFYKSKVN